MANEVKIKLTDVQKAKIKEATGRDLPEIHVGSVGNNPAVSAPTELGSKGLSGKGLSGKGLSGKGLSGKGLSAKGFKTI